MNYDRVGRIANLLLGGWLFVSAFLMRHTISQELNTALVGTVAVGAALTALYRWPSMRYVNAALGVWLVASSFIVDTRSALTVANNMFVGTLMFGFAFMATERSRSVDRGAV